LSKQLASREFVPRLAIQTFDALLPPYESLLAKYLGDHWAEMRRELLKVGIINLLIMHPLCNPVCEQERHRVWVTVGLQCRLELCEHVGSRRVLQTAKKVCSVFEMALAAWANPEKKTS
jgi:hypothetical protein